MDEDSEASERVDFGDEWTDGITTWPRWRVSWSPASGYLVATHLTTAPNAPSVLLGVIASEADLRKALKGWENMVGTSEGVLDWLRSRIASWHWNRTQRGEW